MNITRGAASYCVSICLGTDPSGPAELELQRSDALLQWLRELYNSSWNELQESWKFSDSTDSRSRDPWKLFLLGTEVARIKNTDSSGPDFIKNLDRLAKNPIRLMGNIHLPLSNGTIHMPFDHKTIQSNLRTAYHPDTEGVNLTGISDSTVDLNILQPINTAIELLSKACSDSFSLVNIFCRSICLLQTDPPLPSGECVSLTSKLIPNLVYMTPVPPILAAESLVHESAHLELTALERYLSIYADSNKRIITPLRKDPRPVSGLLHQVWVLLYLNKLYANLVETSDVYLERNREQIIKRFRIHQNDLTSGAKILFENRSEFSAMGKGLVDFILLEIKGILIEST